MTTQSTTLGSEPAKGGGWIPLGLLVLAAVPTAAGIMRLVGLAGGGIALPHHDRFAAAPIPTVLHIVGATTFFAVGALQFWPGLRRRRPTLHRVSGWALAPLGMVAAVAGIWMTLTFPPKEYDGPALTAMRLVAGSAMAVFIVVAVVAVIRRDFTAHGAWITRAYALGGAAGTQVFTLMPFILFESLRSANSHAAMMGAGWVLNLLVAERVIRRRQVPHGPTMRAVLHERYGGPEHLLIGRAPKPKPGAGHVLVRVHAASINAADYRIMRADPFLVRLQHGLFSPRRPLLGVDFSGVVDAVGSGVTGLAIGERVFGEASLADGLGAFAEYVSVRADAVVEMPDSLDFREAAALPLASVTALQAVRDRAKVQPGQSVLVHGAGGGVGMYLVQIAKAYGARVTAVCGPGSVDIVRALGADRVLDYTKATTSSDERHDAVFGVNGYRPLSEYRRLLATTGRYVMVGGTSRQIFEALLFGWRDRRVHVLTVDGRSRKRDLEEVRDLLLHRRVGVVIDSVFSFSRAQEALRHAETGHVRGKVVLDVVRP